MKIYFSPFFNGHTYVDYSRRSLIGETIESEAGLLSRLELMCGMAYPDEDDLSEKSRVTEYYRVLVSTVMENQPLYDSIHNDSPGTERYNVTTELLRWRDSLILAGWDRTAPLPGKLSVISNAEKEIPEDGNITDGDADRWLRLRDKVSALKGRVEVETRCPDILIPKLVRDVISQLRLTGSQPSLPSAAPSLKECRVIRFNELYRAYEWLAHQPVTPGQVIVCNDGDRLDNVMNCFGRPLTSRDANTGCHHTITDVRSMLDTPGSLIWIDCNGGYNFTYAYDFITEGERAAMPDSVTIPDKGAMIKAVHHHYVESLNSVSSRSSGVNVTLVTSVSDAGKPLTQHPMVACALMAKDGNPDETNPEVTIACKSAPDRIRFTGKPHYSIGTRVDVGSPRMSYSALDTLIQTPFNHVVEKELGLYEPFRDEDIRTIKGKVAHKIIELMVRENDNRLDLELFDKYLAKALEDEELVDRTSGKCILDLPENRFEREDLEFNMRASLATLISIINSNSLEIVGSEVSIPENAGEYIEGTGEKHSVEMPDFGKSVAYIDMILRRRNSGDYYIFDFKYSLSGRYAEKLEENRSIQFAFYTEMFNRFYRKDGATLRGIGYYLFPKCTLYVPADFHDGLHEGEHIQVVEVDHSNIADTLQSVRIAYNYRRRQFAEGIIEEGEKMDIDRDYSSQQDIFPLEEDKTQKGTKAGPYSPNHIVLKNQIR